MELGRDEALLQPGLGQGDQAGLAPCAGGGPAILVEPAVMQPPQVVGEPLALPPAGERHHGVVARAGQLLQLGLGLLHPPGLHVGGLRPERVLLVLVDAGQTEPGALVQGL